MNIHNYLLTSTTTYEHPQLLLNIKDYWQTSRTTDKHQGLLIAAWFDTIKDLNELFIQKQADLIWKSFKNGRRNCV